MLISLLLLVDETPLYRALSLFHTSFLLTSKLLFLLLYPSFERSLMTEVVVIDADVTKPYCAKVTKALAT
ncbi:hypothetical protein LBW99_06400, partial [Wolbachia endosymbiont of Nasonia oneida]